MKVCIPYAESMNSLMSSLFSEIGVDFIIPPRVSKYTVEIGETYATEGMCAGIKLAVGSIAECYYLGADTAIVFGPCGYCTHTEIENKISHCLKSNGINIKIISFSPKRYGVEEFLSFLKSQLNISPFKLFPLRKELNECLPLIDEYNDLCFKIRANNGSDKDFETFVGMGKSEINKAARVSDLKIIYKSLLKKMKRFDEKSTAPTVGILDEKYSSLDFMAYSLRENLSFMGINSTNILSFSEYFKKREYIYSKANGLTDFSSALYKKALLKFKNADGIVCAFPRACWHSLALKGVTTEAKKELNVPILQLQIDNIKGEKEFCFALGEFRKSIARESEKVSGAILFRD